IILADKTRHYDGTYLETHLLGGTESSVIQMARELARRKHGVTVYTNCDRPLEHEGVHWKPLSDTPPVSCDLYVAVHQPKLLGFVRKPRRRAIWVVWPVNQLKHYKKIWRSWWYRPVAVLVSLHQVRMYSAFLPHRDPHIVIPHGLPDDVRGLFPAAKHPPAARDLHVPADAASPGACRDLGCSHFASGAGRSARCLWRARPSAGPGCLAGLGGLASAGRR